MNRYEKKKKAVEESIRDRIEQYKAIYKKADDEDRDPTTDERLEIEQHLKAIEVLKTEKEEAEENIKTLQGVEDIGRSLGPAVPTIEVKSEPLDRWHQNVAVKTLGEEFTDSAQFKAAVQMYRQSGDRLPQGWSTGVVELGMKGTLLEGAGGGGGALAATVPQVVGGVVEKLFQRLTFADLVLSGQASTNSLRYVVEGTATSGAAGVPEAGSKPESTLGLTVTDEPIKKIATMLPVSSEMIEDAPAIQSYINGRLTLFVKIEEERQLFRGTSGGNEVQGILTSRNVPVYTAGTTDNKAVQMFKAMNSMRGSAFVEPDWMIIHPTDWQIMRLLTDTAGQLMGGGPFQGPYGNGANFDASNQLVAASDTLWNKPVYVTGAIGGAGTALIGTRAGAQVWRRGGISVEATNSHSTWFQLNLLAIRAEERLGLAVYRPGAYVEARLAVGPGG